MEEKFIIVFRLQDEDADYVRRIMDEVAALTALPSSFYQLPPHVTFHRPIVGISYEKLRNLVESSVLKLRRTRFRFSGLDRFGNQFVVLPVHATRTVAEFWVTIQALLASVPEYRHGAFDYDNTLHITVVSCTHEVLTPAIWNAIRKKVVVDARDIAVHAIEIWGKPSDGVWKFRSAHDLPDETQG